MPLLERLAVDRAHLAPLLQQLADQVAADEAAAAGDQNTPACFRIAHGRHLRQKPGSLAGVEPFGAAKDLVYLESERPNSRSVFVQEAMKRYGFNGKISMTDNLQGTPATRER